MKYKYTVMIELDFDDENGEYAPPSTKEIENRLAWSVKPLISHMGFEKDFNIEASREE